MPWKESDAMSERMKFVIRLEEGERLTDLCKEFQISRKTGYKIWSRYKECGVDAFVDRSRRPIRIANETDSKIQKLILDLKEDKPTWGAPKILEYLKRRYSELQFPARSTTHAILERNGLVKKRGRVRYKSTGTNLKVTSAPNDLWCVDFKGQFKLKNQRYCYPLTMTDHYSRYLLCCESLENTKTVEVIPVFKRVFQEFGIPHAIRSDNGTPFASTGYYGLSALSVFWLKLGIKIERIRPGNPQENGRHERFHKTLKADATRPSGNNHIQQQEKFDRFIDTYNSERPHEALSMKTPSDLYKPASKKFDASSLTLSYPMHDRTHRVSINGNFEPKKGHCINLGKAFASEFVGSTEVEEGLWKISFASYDIAFYDFYDKKLERISILDFLEQK